MLRSSINQSLRKGAGVKKVENSLSSAKYNPRLYRDSVHNGLSGLAKPKGSAGYVRVCVCVCASGSAARSWSHANDIAGKKRACPQKWRRMSHTKTPSKSGFMLDLTCIHHIHSYPFISIIPCGIFDMPQALALHVWGTANDTWQGRVVMIQWIGLGAKLQETYGKLHISCENPWFSLGFP